MSKVACGEITVTEEVDAATFRGFFYTPNVLAHTLHFWWASIAVSGVFLFWLTRKYNNPQPYVLVGARVALAATALQLPTGLWLLLVTPPQSQSKLVGGDGLTTGLFVASLIGTFYLLQNLATLALGADHVLGVAMPGPFSSPHSVTDALALGRQLGIEVRTVDITAIYEAYLSVFGSLFGEKDDFGIAQQNIQSRIRGAVTMAISNAENRLVLATGNKSELSVDDHSLKISRIKQKFGLVVECQLW